MNFLQEKKTFKLARTQGDEDSGGHGGTHELGSPVEEEPPEVVVCSTGFGV